MNYRKIAASVLVGLSLAVLGLFGCEQRITNVPQPPVPPVPVEPADQIVVSLVWPSSPSTAHIIVSQAGSVVGDTTLSNPSGTTDITFSGLTAGTFQISVSAAGFTPQGGFVSIVDTRIPTLTITMTAIAQAFDIEVGESDITDPNITTTIDVAQSASVMEIAGTSVPQASVAVSGVTGKVTVVSTGQSQVPPVLNTSGDVTSSVISALQIQIPADNPTASVAVSLPLPLDPTEFAAAAGGSVDIISFDFATASWVTIGKATIGADGRATTTVTGLKTDNIIAVGVPPTVGDTETVGSNVQTLSPPQVSNLQASGEKVFTYNVNPTVVFTQSKPAVSEGIPFEKPAIRDAPAGVPAQYWAQAVPIMKIRAPDLGPWLDGTGSTASLDISSPVTKSVVVDRTTRTFRFQFRFGGVTRTWSITITYQQGKVIVIHVSGVGGG
jgi:hypothetical protein